MTAPSRRPAPTAGGHFFRRFWPLFVLGLVGVASLLPTTMEALRYQRPPAALAGLPRPAAAAVLLLPPTLLLLVGTLVGAALAHRVGLRSHLAARVERGEPLWPRLRSELPQALSVGVLLGILVRVLDIFLRPLLGDVWLAADPPTGPRTGPEFVTAALFGGTVEELVLRWGLVSLVAWVVWWAWQRGKGAPTSATMWSAILLAALLFAALQLPATADVAPLTGWLVARTLLLNALTATALGWLFWRRSLEAAMVGHVAVLVGVVLVTQTLRLLG